MNKLWNQNWIIAIAMLMLLAGCTGERCVEPDDFGHANFIVSSRYNIDELSGQVGENQVAGLVN